MALLPDQVKIVGDTATALPYVTQAKRYAHLLRTQTPVPPIRTYFPNIGVMVQIDLLPNQNRILIFVDICSLYLDSGLLYLGNLAPLAAARYDDGKLYVGKGLFTNKLWGPASATAGGLAPANSTGKAWNSGDIPGCAKNYLGKDADGNDIYRTDKDEFYGYKLTLPYCPPSMFSGKMRLYVQALYGREYLDEVRPFSVVDVAGVPQIDLRSTKGNAEDKVRIYNIAGQTWGLHTTDDYTYWLIGITARTVRVVTIIPLELTDCGKAALATITKTMSREEKALIEGYALAGAQPNPSRKIEIRTKLPADATPVAYGWSFNWNGSQAIMTTVKRQGEGANSKNYSMRLTLNFKRTNLTFDPNSPLTEQAKEKQRWTVTWEKAEKGVWQTQFGLQNIWAIRYYSTGAELELFQDINPNVIPSGSGEFYSFFDRNDKIIECTAGAEETPGYNETYTDPIWYTTTQYYCLGYTGRNVSRTINGGVKGFMSVGGLMVSSINYGIASGGTVTEWGVIDDGGGWVEQGTAFAAYYNGFPTATAIDLAGINAAEDAYNDYVASNSCAVLNYRRWYGTTWKHTYTLGPNGGETERNAVVIPKYDCSSVYLLTNGRRVVFDYTADQYNWNDGQPIKVGKRCTSGSGWFDANYIADRISTLSPAFERSQALGGGQQITQAGGSETYIGWAGVCPSNYAFSSYLLAPQIDNVTSGDVHLTETSAVHGDLLINTEVRLGGYTNVPRNWKVFVGGA